MRYSFWGNTEFSAVCLKQLADLHLKPEYIVTTSPKHIGKKQILTPNPVDKLGTYYHIPVFYADNLKDEKLISTLKEKRIDLAIVASFGKIIPYQYFKIYKKGMINVHPSLLPKYRGPSPIQNSILNGDFETGVTLFIIDNEVDHGPIIGQTKALIDFKDNYESLSVKLAKLGANLINFIMPSFLSGKTYIKIQNENLTTFTKKFNFQDGYINWNDTSFNIYNKIRALYIEPGTYSYFIKNEKKCLLKIFSAQIFDFKNVNQQPGTVTMYQNKVLVKTKDTFIELLRVQPEGKNKMDARSFINGNPINFLN